MHLVDGSGLCGRVDKTHIRSRRGGTGVVTGDQVRGRGKMESVLFTHESLTFT